MPRRRYLHTGQFGVWNISALFPSFSVVAQTEEDFQATVAFAQQYNLRLVIKGTGHDWYGRSAAAGSLMLWTHARSNITFIDAWTPQVKLGHPRLGHPCRAHALGPPATAQVSGSRVAPTPIPAVTVQTGVQFKQLYATAEAAGK